MIASGTESVIDDSFFDSRIVDLLESLSESSCHAALGEFSNAMSNPQSQIRNPKAYFMV